MWRDDQEQPGARRWAVITGDCRETMDMLADDSVDSVVCDPPYELGFMGKAWDASGIAYDLEVWRHALRVLKPGGHLLAFSGSRTYHRMACAIEDAGFEIRDQIMWVYGSGFPKSHDVSKAIDREAGAEREVVGRHPNPGSTNPRQSMGDGWQADPMITAPATPAAERWSGWGTALKPAHEPIVVARKPFKGTVAANVLAHGTGALNIDECRVGTEERFNPPATANEGTFNASPGSGITYTGHTVSGRWPANFIHDGSDEVLRLFPVTAPAKKNKISDGRSAPFMQAGGEKTGGFSGRHDPSNSHDDAGGSAARFFYCPKASKADREDGLAGFTLQAPSGLQGRNDGSLGSITIRRNHHPTVKPTELMRYLCRLVTPPGGLVLDPFTGSGSTGRGAVLEGFRFLGCELSPEYSAIARGRIAAVESRADL